MFPPPVRRKKFCAAKGALAARWEIFVCAKNYSSYICYLAWWSVITIHIIAQEVFLFLFPPPSLAVPFCFFAPHLFKGTWRI
jgi:hypothetical protein